MAMTWVIITHFHPFSASPLSHIVTSFLPKIPVADSAVCVETLQEFIDDVGVKDSDATRSKLRKKMNLDKELKDWWGFLHVSTSHIQQICSKAWWKLIPICILRYPKCSQNQMGQETSLFKQPTWGVRKSSPVQVYEDACRITNLTYWSTAVWWCLM